MSATAHNPQPPAHAAHLMLGLTGPRISRITIARLHNMGNYEHVRYEVTVEIPAGASPAAVAEQLEDTLADLTPKAPYSAWTLANAIKDSSAPQPPDDTPQRDQHDNATRIVQEYNQWKQQRAAALARLDTLGGTSRHTDAKTYWGDEA